MTDKPIIFSGPMVRALLDGRKTQTRRVLKPSAGAKRCGHTILRDYNKTCEGRLWWWDGKHNRVGFSQGLPYAIGDRLWVREAWRTFSAYDSASAGRIPAYVPCSYEADYEDGPNDGARGRYRHARFMPRLASRLTLTVTDVRVQRVQDISEADAKAEGAGDELHPDSPHGWRDSFAALWDPLNAKRGYGWDANPWVCALTFDAHRCNIDKMEG